MAKLKILAEQMAKFVELASSKGKIESALYKITEEKITSMTSAGENITNVHFISDIELDGGQYSYSGEEMQLAIKDNKMFMEVLQDFGKAEVDITIVNNYVIIENGNSRAELSISSPEYIKSAINKKPNLSYDNLIKLHSVTLKKIFKNMKRLDASFVFLKVENGILSMITGDENLDRITEKMEVELPNMTVKFGKLLQYAIDVTDGELEVGIGNDYPMRIVMESEGIIATYYVINCD